MQTDITIQRLAYNIPDACKVLSTSRQTLYNLIDQGRLRSFTEGRRRYVSRQAIDDYIMGREQQQDSAA
jgi:excisionase family DNA binding protein